MNIQSLLTYITTSIFAVEQSFPQNGLGKTKKQVILNTLETLVKATGVETSNLAQAGSNIGTNQTISELSNLASSFIDSTVNVLNNHKVFKK